MILGLVPDGRLIIFHINLHCFLEDKNELKRCFGQPTSTFLF